MALRGRSSDRSSESGSTEPQDDHDDIADLTAQVVFGAAMHHCDAVAGFQELCHQRLADESRSSDNEAIHGRAFIGTPGACETKSVVILQA